MKNNRRFLLTTRIFFKLVRLPLLYSLLALSFLAFDYIDDFILHPSWKFFLNYNGKIAKIFFSIAILTLIYNLVSLLLKRFEKKLFIKHRITTIIIANIRHLLSILLFLIIINVITWIISPTDFYLSITEKLTRSIFIIAIGIVALQLMGTVEAIIYQHIKISEKNTTRTKAIYTKTRIVKNIVTVLIILITIGVLLMSFTSVRNLGVSILASAGFLTAILGFAAQKPLSAIFSGLQIALSQPIKIGDVVVVQGQSGVIEELTFTNVVLKLGDRRRLIVPLNTFIDNSFENWSRDSGGLQNSIYLNVDYRISIDDLRKQLTKILQNSTYWNGSTNLLYISDLGSEAVQLRIQVSASNANYLLKLMTEVREKMLLFLQTHHKDKLPKLSG